MSTSVRQDRLDAARRMARPVGLLVVPLLIVTVAAVQHSTPRDERPPILPGSLGSLHHPISTANGDSQRLFDQGLTLYYGFNRDAAYRAFALAARLDPRAAMPQVGIALARGPNLNMDADAAQLRAACDASRTALAQSRGAAERGYASAATARYCTVEGRVSGVEYADAMNALRHELPDDPDASVLYADSLMELRPRLITQEAEIVSVLESVLRQNPSHVGANHFYIHAVEGSTAPMRALESARRLETLVPGVGHLLHMPSHIYMRAGDYDAAIASNLRAASADLSYLQQNPPGHDGAMYYLHDLESLAVADGFAGRFADARSAAREIARVEAGLAGKTPDHHFPAPLAFVLLRFRMWRDVVALPVPPTDDVLASLLSSFARAEALLGLNRLPEAKAEGRAFEHAAAAIPDGVVYRSNPIAQVRAVLRAVLVARLEQAEHGPAAAVDAWQRAVDAQDRLAYHEPPPFYYPTHETLGAALLAAGRLDDAERVFREDVSRHPGNGRSLFGLWQVLRARGPAADAERTHDLFLKAWAHADVELSLSSF
jgi:tetratricopeptide (TPR) repeat protein